MSSNWRIGAEDASAPIAIWGYLSLIHAANTDNPTKQHQHKFITVSKFSSN